MDALETPRHLDSLNAAWIDSALRRSNVITGSKIANLVIEKIGEGEGFLGEIARLHLLYEEPRSPSPASVIVKLPTTNRRLRAIGESMGVYEREIRFYTQLAARLPLRLPRCYFAQVDQGAFGVPQMNPRFVAWVNRMPRWLLSTGIAFGPWLPRLFRQHSVLILEDLGFARPGNQAVPGAPEDLQAALESLARIHAECWNDPRVADLPWLQPLGSSERIFAALLARQRRRFEVLFGGSIPDGAGATLDWLQRNLGAVHRRLAQPPCTLIHGDYRLDNLFFDDSGDEGLAIVADWQLSAWGRGPCDLAYLLSSSLDTSLSAQAEISYVAHYHASLQGLGVSNYSLEECQNDYRLALLFVVGRIVSSLGVLEPANERAEKLLRLWVERVFSRLRGVDLERVL